uniref:Uncharacterized protein n=1 Tax=Leptocylindrus danicus TaxID=163516 RepID=A0A7S2L766_9STRA
MMDELMWNLPHSNDYATYRRDNAEVYNLISTEALKSQILLNWFNSDGVEPDRNGRKGFLSIRRCCLGTDSTIEKCASLQASLGGAHWTGYGQGKASEKLVATLFRIYSELSAVGKEYTELEKMENFQTASHPQQELLGSTCQKAVDDKVMEYIRRLQNGERRDAFGRQLTFSEFTSFLINEEKQWLKIQKAKRSVSQDPSRVANWSAFSIRLDKSIHLGHQTLSRQIQFSLQQPPLVKRQEQRPRIRKNFGRNTWSGCNRSRHRLDRRSIESVH